MMSYQPDPLLSLHHGPGAILIAAGDQSSRAAMARHLGRLGHSVLEAASGADVLDRLHGRGIAGLVLDLGLPEETPLELLPRVLERDPNLAVVVISEQTDAQTASLCMRQGAFDFLTKPVEPPVLERALERALSWRVRVMTDRETQKLLRAEVAERAELIRQERVKLQLLAESSLQTLVAVMEAKDPFFAGHSLRVGQMAASIAAKLGRTDQEVEQVRMAGTLHDLGMIAVSAQVTGKAGPLTAEEFDDVKRHPVIGAQLLAPYPDLAQIARFVRGHHERWDGAGYPDGLARQEIPWGARVLAAAEIYDAMTSTRAYRDRIGPDEVLELMHALVGETLDPGIFEALAEVIGRRQALEFVESDRQHDAVEKLIAKEVAPHAA